MIKMDKGSEYSLKWNSHKSTVMSAFTCLFENEKHADCTLAAEGRFIKVHQVMMSACSPYLERLLEEHSKDKNSHPIVIFNDLSYFELKALCEYMYKGEVNVPMENLDNFLKVAKVMQVRGLCDGGGGESIGGLEKSGGAKASPAHHVIDKRKQGPAEVKHQMMQQQQQGGKRKRQDGFDSDASSDNVSYVTSSPRGRGKGVKQAKVIATCTPRVVQEVKPEVIKYEEPETVYEETVCQDLTFEEEIYQDPNNEAGTSNNETGIDFGAWNDGNSNEYNQDTSNQEQEDGPNVKTTGKNKKGKKNKGSSHSTVGALSTKTATKISLVKAGTFVLVEFFGGRKSTTRYRYAAVCQGCVDEDSEVEVMSLKTRGSDKVLFKQDDNDICFIRFDQIIEILPEPSIVMQGNRVLYKFPKKINVQESS